MSKPKVFKACGQWVWLCTHHEVAPAFEVYTQASRDPWCAANAAARLHAARYHEAGTEVESVE